MRNSAGRLNRGRRQSTEKINKKYAGRPNRVDLMTGYEGQLRTSGVSEMMSSGQKGESDKKS